MEWLDAPRSFAVGHACFCCLAALTICRAIRRVELSVWKYFKDLKAMHAYYASLGGNSNAEVGASSFVMVKTLCVKPFV